ncbi:MAG: SprT family zinc-dependent metalloprotease [Desulfotomaculaceae bacterium]|nr:SprT family zinc-dependent metalloprotease [Desulfotomaculaceae bacterium]
MSFSREMKDSINLDGCIVPYTIRRSSRARRLLLQVRLDSCVFEVVAPEAFNLVDLKDILMEKKVWILKKLEAADRLAAERQANQPQERSIFYRGRQYLVETRVEPGSTSAIEVEEDRLVVVVPPGVDVDPSAILERWLRQMARLLINQRIRVMNEKLKLPFKRVFIKGQRTRWGSCSQQKNLNFNWRLVMAPLPVLDYIVAHELAHLVEMNHSKKFWALVEQIYPGYSEHRAWLKKNGRLLTLPD